MAIATERKCVQMSCVLRVGAFFFRLRLISCQHPLSFMSYTTSSSVVLSDTKFNDSFVSNMGHQPQQLYLDKHTQPRPTLKLRPQINFSGRYPGIGINTFSGPTLTCYPPSVDSSHMSGSMLHSSFHPLANIFLRKAFPFDELSLMGFIALLTKAQLQHNPHHVRLQQKYDHVCELLIGRDLAENRAAQHDPINPNIYQGA